MYTFKKEERLCSKKLLEQLFHNGSSFLLYPFKLTWLSCHDVTAPKIRIVVIVSKRRFKRAVDRNRIKRLIRETYRLNKHAAFINQLGEQQILLSVNYIGKEIPEFENVNSKMLKASVKLISQIKAGDAGN